MFRFWSLVIGYALGCVQWAYIFGKLRGIDIRTHGSGNAGMTNVTRVMGGKAGLAVFLLDMLKAAAAYYIAVRLLGGFEPGAPNIRGVYAGLGVVIGHCFPFYMGFRGGKGVSSTLALAIVMDWRVALIIACVGVPLLAWKRYVSLVALVGSAMLAVLFAAAWAWRSAGGLEISLIVAAIAALIWYKHRANLKRLINGTESKFLSKKDTGHV